MTVKQLGERDMPTQFDFGFLVGLLVGEGHFGGDGRQPHVTLRMHVRHEAIFRWLERTFPGGRVYGPYHHGGRDYLQWMARGSFLRDELAPVLDRTLLAHGRPALGEAHPLLTRARTLAERLGIAVPYTVPGLDEASLDIDV